LTVEPDTKENEERLQPAGGAVSVTVTSDPPGATVRTPGGQVLGVTPAMFVLPDAPPDGGSSELVVELAGHARQTVGGKPVDGELVLHATLAPAGPIEHVATAQDPQPIRDFRTATLTTEVVEDCEIGGLDVGVSLRHTYIGDLMIQVRSPSGRTATLHRFRGGARHDLDRSWSSRDTRGLERLHGDRSAGTWTLSVRDAAELDSGSLDRFTLRVECADPAVR
jgi:hypothetical protein